ncbi:lipopolysaccharide/colanic/teichoic acid biosynthesis glycosyltransferase [Rhodoblastus acidophilus]|uniref:sugar transferase n=1 Tax=Rhodoblastus acidophilus TaxID=1074 RepID=UPI0022254982|nr:sugar transferase [Rhodoblastus acidophilus]MCW2285384.1 lipopolysaccharide/colanic/teichoic acid biosynthesis glycosyltransferase [Rhodoblastus acidophilus]MCW2334368.1 lipopolysaccharide/colanic/teichoic acid biosynthesis glycosyltransferase [Rhodoblastus acidophilus]
MAKRALDVFASACGLAALAPLFMVVAVAVKLDSPGPAFFRQTRVGRDGKPFRIWKFRSMRAAGRGPSFTAEGDARITRVGAWIRAAKIDELPQLINVFVGDMSLVGPRPETPDLLEFYAPDHRAQMLSVRPGVTDYASLFLRDEGALLAQSDDAARFYREKLIPMKALLLRRYLAEMSLRADIRIVLLTVAALFRRGARTEEEAHALLTEKPWSPNI